MASGGNLPPTRLIGRGRARVAGNSQLRGPRPAGLTTTASEPAINVQARGGPRPSAPRQAPSLPRPASAPGLEQGKGRAGLSAGGAATNGLPGPGQRRPSERPKDAGIYKTRAASRNSKLGTSGDPVTLTSNHFRLNAHTDWCLYQYRVDYEPDEDRTFVRKLLMRSHKEFLKGYIFEGTVMYTSHRLFPESKDELELFSRRSNDDVNIRMRIRQVGDIVMGDSHYVQVFNILMRMSLSSLRLQLVGHDFFDALSKIEVQQWKLELWPGYKTSIRQHEDSILMCTEVLHKVMRKDTVLDLYMNCVRDHPTEFRKEFLVSVIGSVVLTDYNNRTYTIDDVDFQKTPCETFEKQPGQHITYLEYYKTKYGLVIRPDQPLLVSKSKPRERRAGCSELVYIVPELCRCTGFTDAMRTNFRLMQDLHHHTRLGPEARVGRLMKFNRKLSDNEEVRELFTKWNLKLASELCTFRGRVLPQEEIIVKSKKHKAGHDTDWTKSLRYSSMLMAGSLTNWCVVGSVATIRDARIFVDAIIQAGHCMKFNISRPDFFEIQGQERMISFNETLEQVISERNPQLILCAVTTNAADRYSAIKKKCCVDRAVPTQVVTAKSMRSKNIVSVATKVAIQMNCKIGGAPWAVEIPMADLMVVGFDVCHDTRMKGKSYGALVCSLDKPLSRYFSHVSAHTSGEELSNHLSVGMTAALASFQAYNEGRLPERIAMYRDGVGDGQIPYVLDCEIKHLMQTLTVLYNGQPPKLAFLIVSKRIDTRIFMNNRNPPSGTVADDVITLPHRFDFFLVSQSVRQGTVSPTSYNVIFDNMGLTPDKLQRLTYKLTHLYFNWSGTVRVPAPVQYAHKLAFLVGQAIHAAPSQQLQDSLYFL